MPSIKELDTTEKASIVQSGISFMRSITEVYGSDEGMKLWDTIADTLDPQIKGHIFFAMITGEFNHMIAGTAWGAWNALTERLDWYRGGKKGLTESILAGSSGFDPQITAEKQRLLQVVNQVLAA